MAQVKAPDIPQPKHKEYRTVEDYISGFTRRCSNEICQGGFMASMGVHEYAPWLTPDHARSVALIAREETIDEIKEKLLSEVLPCFMHGGEADEVVAKLDEVLREKLKED